MSLASLSRMVMASSPVKPYASLPIDLAGRKSNSATSMVRNHSPSALITSLVIALLWKWHRRW